MFESLHRLCTRETRLVVAYFSHLWYPALKAAEAVGLRMPQPPQNVLSPADVRALVALADFEPVKSEKRVLSPMRLLGRRAASSTGSLRRCRSFASLCLRHYTVCRSLRRCADRREVGDGRDSGPQRARQYRSGGAAHSALRRRDRDHLRRRPLQGRHLGGDPARHRRLSALRHQGDAAARQGQGATPCLPPSRLRAATS